MAREPGDGGNIAQDVLHAVVELGHQQALALLVALALRDIEHRPHHVQALLLLVVHRLAAIEHPAHLAVRTYDLELELATPRLRAVTVDVPADHVPVIGMDHGQRRLEGQRLVALEADQPAQEGRPIDLARRSVVVVGAEARRLAGKTEALGGFAHPLRRCLELGGALAYAPLQLAVQPSSCRVLRHSSTKIFTLARRISGTTGTGT